MLINLGRCAEKANCGEADVNAHTHTHTLIPGGSSLQLWATSGECVFRRRSWSL